MKKETIFKHELNESIQANAAMNCLKNRNKPQQMNESKFLADILRVALFLLRPLIKKIVQSLIIKFGAKLTGRQVAKMVIKNVSNGKTIMKVGKKVGQTWTKIPPELKQEIAKSAVDTWKEMRAKKAEPQVAEQEETSDFDTRFEFRKDLRELASPVAKKAYMIIRKQYGDSMWRQLGMDDCDEQGLIDMLNMYAEDGLKPQQIVNKMMGVREDEETVDYAQLADDVCASYRGTLSKLDLKGRINYIVKMIAKKIGKTVDALTPQELTAIQKAAKHSVWYVSEQEEHPEDADRLQSQLADAWDEGMEDDIFDPYDNKFDKTYDDVVWKLISAVWHYFEDEADVEGFNIFKCTENQIGKAIEQILDKHDDMPSSRDFKKCYAWVRKHAEEIIRILETGSLENTYEGHPEFDFNEQEEMPSMERQDMIFALSEYMSESWIDTGDDGDLDDIYYAIADILDRTGDYPASTSWEDCKPWCQKYYQEVEARIYNEEEEASCTSKVTVRTPMGMKQMNLSTEVIEAFVQQTGSHEFSDRSAVRIIAGIVKEMAKKGYTPTEDEQKIVDIQNKKIKQTMASRNAATDRSMNALSD